MQQHLTLALIIAIFLNTRDCMNRAILQEKPGWLKIVPPRTKNFEKVRATIRELGMHTVCQSAHCPNAAECWDSGTATFMVLGNTCTRACRFCAVNHSGKGDALDNSEPKNLARAVKEFGLKYVVITSVDRDDLEDFGVEHFAECIREVKSASPETVVEVLIPDFNGNEDCIGKIVGAKPDVIGHNVETVRALQFKLRDRRASFEQSLLVLRKIKELNPKIFTKSSIMVGLGETEEQVLGTMGDLRAAKVDFLTIGQYLQPSKKHFKLKEYISPARFEHYKKLALHKGFLYCASGPFVRSSYKAGEFFVESLARGNGG